MLTDSEVRQIKSRVVKVRTRFLPATDTKPGRVAVYWDGPGNRTAVCLNPAASPFTNHLNAARLVSGVVGNLLGKKELATGWQFTFGARFDREFIEQVAARAGVIRY